jgi:IclR family acetate operon transcriptional repressor
MRGANGYLDGSSYSIRAVHRVCDILDLLQQSPDGVALPDVASVTRLPKSSAFRYLATLEQRRYVEREPASGSYRAGSALLPLRAHEPELLARRARPHMERLRDRLEETVNLGMLEGNRVIYLEIVESHRAMRLAARRGDRDPIHSTALGKAIAAWMPEERVRAILGVAGLPRLTQRTITDLRSYLAELAQVRERGYAVDNGEHEIDGRCVAVPVADGNLPAAISLSAPASRFAMNQVEEVAATLKEIVAALTGDLSGDLQSPGV